MPNRILKESICTSATLDALSAEEETFFYRLIVQCDDYGRMDGRAPVLRARCFPLRLDRVSDADVTAWLAALVRAGLVRLYEVDGRAYLEMVTFTKAQQVRARRSKYPDPPACGEAPPPAVDSKRNHATADASGGTQIPPYSYSESNPTRESNPAPSAAKSPPLASATPTPEPDRKEVPPELRGRSLVKAAIPRFAELVLTPQLKAHARKCGCTNPEKAWEHWHLERWKKRDDPRTWCTDWLADFVSWMLNHDRFGCPCQRRPTPADNARDAENRRKERSVAAPTPGRGGELTRVGDLAAESRRVG